MSRTPWKPTRLLLGFLALSAASSVYAQCPANSLDKLAGTNWAFELHASDYQNQGYASVGRFSADIKNGQGALTIKETVVEATAVTRLAGVSGRYTVYQDCSGGELFFNLNGAAVQLEYVFDRDDRLQLVNDSHLTGLIQPVITGVARKIGPVGCPAGTNPLTLLTGNSIALQSMVSEWAAINPRNTSGSIGSIVGSIKNGAGVIDAVETVNNEGAVSRLAKEFGRFQVYDDCSGGEIMLMDRNPAVQLEFVFSTTDFSETFFLSDSIQNSYQLLIGATKRQTPVTCPANPLNFLNGTTWSFEIRGANVGDPTSSAAAIGRFTATVAANGLGVLSVSETTRDANIVRRLIQGSGRYIVYPDCSGGELMFMTSSQAVQYEFVVVNDSELYLVSDSVRGTATPGAVLVGIALKNPPASCPAGVSPLSVLDQTKWAFRTWDPFFTNLGYTLNQFFGSASVGTFSPFIKNGAGLLSAVETTNNSGTVYRLQQENGRYIVYPDCSGGEIMLMDRIEPVQFEFVFNGPNLDDMFLLSDTQTTDAFINLEGRARKQ